MRIALIILAAGVGKRFSKDGIVPKQYIQLLGHPVIYHAVKAFLPHVDYIQPVGDPDTLNSILLPLDSKKILSPIHGGKERQDSVKAGLEALSSLPEDQQPDIVLVHDGARPNISAEIIHRVIDALKDYSAAIPAIPVAETLKRNKDNIIGETVSRDGLFRAQTPQGFHFKPFLDIHRKAAGSSATDDAALFEDVGLKVALVQGDENNIKLTYQEDLKRLECLMSNMMLPRIGSGFDVHAFEKDRPLYLCGIEVPHELGLAGHSDADVGLHALCDAIYGALAEGDIGAHFPPSDNQWKNADSKQFLIHAGERVRQRGGKIINIDLTLICERPKMRPHIEQMREKIAELLQIDVARVSVKATTTEKLGFTGREEGIACQAMTSILLPE
ncbi:bifunctional 2-C-methyl-D-erythritol 4-phosphate cytidylyltransferase/2-C-methyl-D-erythritol 2,4-cyclodiphosphate synthase [Commensalibacter communis]|uniref:bifunctional 2-C-methyl-D-erythritol 4-phosphate cytidylyltransferase/2-C-methyl-D-erythritol 2,4-cyclodiphosphate synthase n=1 Tax=Commensalibacter communis TaxID=2972786 RepID=UPI0022FF9B19|nr:bifunctional 2-C-methyl-D-erythritol 4-phosphate cytidylyltransferase/2-C-methyl-D-erythritol 2,4-cyclodiphosphate synthase [Commensalibacter communis]CAI3934617.1 2C-methyl-D-erythritol 2 [Commensalibacter communis]CAI3943568.1 2C-methyl-D-erythritol 2 [Commensalibacter communis]